MPCASWIISRLQALLYSRTGVEFEVTSRTARPTGFDSRKRRQLRTSNPLSIGSGTMCRAHHGSSAVSKLCYIQGRVLNPSSRRARHDLPVSIAKGVSARSRVRKNVQVSCACQATGSRNKFGMTAVLFKLRCQSVSSSASINISSPVMQSSIALGPGQ